MQNIKIVDLFAGIGGLKLGVVQGLKKLGYNPEIVFTSEIKPAAVETLKLNYPNTPITGDITKVEASQIPEHSLLLAGFPCQAFSYAGTRKGFEDKTKGTLFFDVLRILKHHKPERFILENVEGLITHDREAGSLANSPGRTLTTIVEELVKIGYSVSWDVLEATDFGVPQRRRRVFITGSLTPANPISTVLKTPSKPLSSILDKGLPQTEDRRLEAFVELLKRSYGDDLSVLEGKIFRDWRGGDRNIHSWNVGLKGEVTAEGKEFLELLVKESKSSRWSALGLKKEGEAYSLTEDHIASFYSPPAGFSVKQILDPLVEANYVRKDKSGFYRISSGKLTWPVSHILKTDSYSNTIVATDCDRLTVIDNGNLRRFSENELRKLFGFPQTFLFPGGMSMKKKCDLFGNSVVVPVAEEVTRNLYGPLVNSTLSS